MRTSLALENVEVSLSTESGATVSKLDSDLNFDELQDSVNE